MLNLEELLAPVPGANPGGRDLRYDPVSERIKEARRVEDDLVQGVWKHELKKADYALVIKLAAESLKSAGKDLQVAAWLAEAATARFGLPGLRQGLELLERLLGQFWEHVHPAIDEDGDLEMRATPLAWVDSQLDRVIRSIPMTSSGLSWFEYSFAKTIPTEASASNNEEKMAQRRDALDRGRPTPEQFEEAWVGTPASFYEALSNEIAGCLERLDSLAALVDAKFGEASPGCAHLRETLEQLKQTIRVLMVNHPGLQQGKAASQRAAPSPAPPPAAEGYSASEWGDEPQQPAAAAGNAGEFGGEGASGTAVPVSGDPFDILAAAARSLRNESDYNPAPYLMLRAARWGELYQGGSDPDPSLLEPPPTAIRVELKRLAAEENWEGVLAATEKAAAMPCTRAWIDLHRYAIRAAENTGRDAVARALRSGLRSLLQDFPKLPEAALSDDTPAASAETRQWLQKQGLAGGARRPMAFPAGTSEPAPKPDAGAPEQSPAPDSFQLAMEAARSGNVEDAFSLLSREAALERSGRGRFLRKMQLAQVCLATGNEPIGVPILRQLDEEIERRGLEEWEEPELISQPLSMLYGCVDNDEDQDTRQRLYTRICRLDPIRALNLGR